MALVVVVEQMIGGTGSDGLGRSGLWALTTIDTKTQSGENFVKHFSMDVR